jgi:HSP20 family protein
MAKSGTQLAPSGAFRNLATLDPFRDLFDLQRSINQLFGEASSKRQDTAISAWTPAVDIFEDEESFVIKAELPEIGPEQVKVNLENNTLSITGERRIENEDKREGYHRVERSYGQFYRSFTLPPNVNADAINAQFKDGVLRLTIPKREESKPKQISVKVG